MDDRERVLHCLKLLREAGAEKAQCRMGRYKKHEMNIEAGEISLFRTTSDISLSLSAIKEGRKGSKALNKIDEAVIRESVQDVIEMADGSEPDTANDIAKWQEPGEFKRGDENPDKEGMYFRLKEFMDDVKQLYPKVILREAFLDFKHSTGCFANSNGVNFKYSKGVYSFELMISSKDGEKTSSFNYSHFSTDKLDRKLLDFGSVNMLLKQSSEQVDTTNIPGKFTGSVIIAPDCLEDFISLYTGNFLSDWALISGTSIFKDRLNQPVANSMFSLHSMPVSDEIPDGYFITQDGYKAENSTIIGKGVLRSFLLSLYGARKTGMERAVNSGGAYVIDPGDASFEDMVKRVGKGLLLCRFSGGRPNANGDFSGVAKNSYYIENGEIKYPVSETMITGNLEAMFRNITGISKERVSFGNSIMPWISVSDMIISGK